jgi:ABC-2 type transport system permease protein
MLHREFFRLRANPIPGLDLQFQNVPFVLNVIDSLADDPRFLKIRKGRQMYGHLTHVEQQVEEVVTSEIERQIDDAEATYKQIEKDAEKKRKQAVDDAQKSLEDMRNKEGTVNISVIKSLEDRMNMTREMATVQEVLDKDRADKAFKKSREKAIEEGKRATYQLNDAYKQRATLLPPILPVVVGVIVFFYRRSREQEGVAKSRLR